MKAQAKDADEAEKSYRKVLDAKVPDPDMRIRKRLIEDFEFYNGFKDKEQLADIKIDDIGLEEEEDA